MFQTGIDEDESNDVEMVCKKLMKINQEYLKNLKTYDQFYEDFRKIEQEIHFKKQAQDAFDATLIVFEEQIQLLTDNIKNATPIEIQP